MLAYIIRRILYAIPILFGVNVIVFFIFFFVNTPDDMAKLHLGSKRITPEQIDAWKREHSLHLPLFFNNGWVQAGSLQVNGQVNQKVFKLEKGDYELEIEAPKNDKLISTRNIQLDFKNVESSWNTIKNSDKITLPSIAGTQKFQFSIIKQISDINKGSLDVHFWVENPVPAHRLILNYKAQINFMDRFTRTIFFTRSLKMLFFDYGRSETGKNISEEVSKRIFPSLVVSLPTFLIGLLLNIFCAMILALRRNSYIDYWGVFIAVVGMSISVMFYIIFGQVILGKYLKLFPISGFSFGVESIRFIMMPVIIATLSGLGGSIRFYRTIFLEEISKEYVTTARGKGLSENTVLFVHVLKNAMIPILTSIVVYLPFLFVGSLLFESFFSIPGLGAFLLDAIQSKDFSTVQAMVSLGSFLYVLGLILTDISYTMIDPRVRFK